MPTVIGVIPSRWGSTRFPGKSLHPLCGKPLLQWVVERAWLARRLDTVLVATDDERIAAAARGFGAQVAMTSPDHPSGTDRVAEAARGAGADAVINIQGDEPLIDPELIDRLAETIVEGDAWDMATAVTPLRDPAAVRNPAVVKAVFARDGRALYFSRSVIPHLRDAAPGAAAVPEGMYWRHIGIYAYRAAFLERLVAEPPCALELAEKLEQLRALDLGGRLRVLRTDDLSLGVDTPADIPLAEAALMRAGLVG